MFKWPFSSRSATEKSRETAKLQAPAPINYEEFLNNDTYIKLWLPDIVENGLSALSVASDSSRQDVLRSVLFRHLYGVVAFEELAQWHMNFLQTPSQHDAGPKFSKPRGIPMSAIGKSTTNMKVWIPIKMKQDLDELAKQNSLGISEYVRKLLVAVFYGESFLKRCDQAVFALTDEHPTDE